jgi:putative copper export protein
MIEVRFLVRAVHTVAGAAWVGGSLMYLFVVLPALRLGGPAPAVAAQVAGLFKRLSNICIGALLLSGAYLTFDRLTQTTLGLPYIVVLLFKLSGALAMIILSAYMGQSAVRRLAKRSTRFSRVAPQLLVALGILVFVLGALLNTLFEATIAPH